MAEEKEVKKKKTSTSKKKTSTGTKKKTAPKKKTTPKKVEVVEEKKEVVEEVKEEETILDNVVDTVKDVADAATAPVKEIISGNIPKKPSAVIYLLVLLFLIFIGILSVYSYFVHEQEIDIKPVHNTYMGQYEEALMADNYYIITTENELSVIFPDQDSFDVDFDKYQYVVLNVIYDSCRENNLKVAGYQLDGTMMTVRIEYEATCGVCSPYYVYYLLELDKDVVFKDITFDYVAINNPHCRQDVAYKPIIYLYPTEETEVSVQLGNSQYLTTTYPTYNHGWKVVASPDGTLKGENGREYYGLFWEGNHHDAYVHPEGFVVKGEDTLSFLEEKLQVLGLNEKEANEFIIYWLPILENNSYNYIYFETMDEINQYMPLTVEPNPQSLIRIQMDYLPLDYEMEVAEQVLTTPTREGFTVVEWGGSIIKD